MKSIHFIIPLVAAVVILCPYTRLRAGEDGKPVPAKKREAKAAKLIAEMETNLAAQLKNKTGRSADFLPPARATARPKNHKKLISSYLRLRKARLNVSANIARNLKKLEEGRIDRFIKHFQFREDTAAERVFDKKMEEVKGRPQRERYESERQARDKLKKKRQAIRMSVFEIKTATTEDLEKSLEKRLQDLYEQYVETLNKLIGIGEKETIPEFEKWKKVKNLKTLYEKVKKRQPRNRSKWEELKDKPDPVKKLRKLPELPKKRTFWRRKPGGK